MLGSPDNAMYGMYPRPDVVTCDSRDKTDLDWDLVAHRVNYDVTRRRQDNETTATQASVDNSPVVRQLTALAFNGGPLPETPTAG